jgi:hypothetical protein
LAGFARSRVRKATNGAPPSMTRSASGRAAATALLPFLTVCWLPTTAIADETPAAKTKRPAS